MTDLVKRCFLKSGLIMLLAASAPAAAQEGAAREEEPSAELIIEAEETIIQEPVLEPGEEPLPTMDGTFPGEQNIFGDDLFGPPTSGGGVRARTPGLPLQVPLLEDPLEAERKMRIRLRKIKPGLDRDARLIELEEMAATAPTPEDYRAARRAYYTLFFAKVRRADATLKDYADKLEKQSLAGLFQSRVEPTWPLQEPPQPQPQASFVPPRQYPDVLLPDEEPVQLP